MLVAELEIRIAYRVPAWGDAAVVEVGDIHEQHARFMVEVKFEEPSRDGLQPRRPSNPGRPLSVTVIADEGLTPSMLQRFPWGRWLRAATAARQKDWDALFSAAGLEIATKRKRPGRRGHDLAHYQGVAMRYKELAAKGESPAKVIANEQGFNQNTVRGWIRRCRELELLPPAEAGRAGMRRS